MRSEIAKIALMAYLGSAAVGAQIIPPPASGPAATPQSPAPQTPPAEQPLLPPPPGNLDDPLGGAPVPDRPLAPPTGVLPSAAPGAPSPAPRSPQQQMTMADVVARIQEMINAGAYEDASLGITTVLRNDPENFEVKLLLAKLHEARQDYMSARTVYLELRKEQPNHFDVNLGLGRLFVMVQYWRQAPGYLEAAERVARPDQKAEVYILLALAHRGVGDLKAAATAAEAAVQADPTNFDARQTLVEIRVAMEQYEQAAADGRELMENATRRVEAEPGQVEALQRLGQAQETLLGVLRMHFTTLYARDAAGRFTDQLLPGKERDAAAFLQQMVEMQLRLAEVRHRLAYHDALLIAERASAMAPENTAVLQDEALLLLNTDQNAAAVAKFQRILEIDPSHAEAIRQLNRMNAPLTSQPAGGTSGGPAASQPVGP